MESLFLFEWGFYILKEGNKMAPKEENKMAENKMAENKMAENKMAPYFLPFLHSVQSGPGP